MTDLRTAPSPAERAPHGGCASEPGAERLPFAILGGGISGLALATWLRREGVEATVIEKAECPGGVMQSVQEDGFLFERGPNTILDRHASLDELIALAGLEPETERVAVRDHARYVWHGGRLHPVPAGPRALLTSRLLTLGGKLRALREPWIAPVAGDETLKDFALRRFGPQVYERLLVPFVSGVGAGDPARMSAAASFPILKEAERSAGSVLRGRARRAKEARRQRAGAPRPSTRMVSFKGGLARLPRALAARLGPAFRPGVAIERVRPLPGGGFHIEARAAGAPLNFHADRLALCGDAGGVADRVRDFEPAAADALAGIHYCPLAIVHLGVDAASLRLPSGFGFLAAPGQGLRILGAIFVSNIFPDRAPQGAAAISVMIGGDLDPDAAALPDRELLDLVRADLHRAIGWNGRARVTRIERWPRAIPQYFMDHAERMAALEAAESRRPGLHFLGNWRDGVALGDRIERARLAAASISTCSPTSPRGDAS